MKRIAAASLVILSTLAGQAYAQQPQRGWYGGISAGNSMADIDSASLGVIGATQSSFATADDKDTAFKFYGGYQFFPNLAVEVGYADLGKFRGTRTVTAPQPGAVNGEIKASGVFGQAVGIIPVGERFSVFATAGLFVNTVKTSASTTGNVVLLSGSSFSNSDVNAKLGVGASFMFTDKVGMRLEWERFVDLGDQSTVGAAMDVDLVTIGVVFRF